MSDIPQLMDLEEQIMRAWHVVDDLDSISERMMNNPDEYTIEHVTNMLIGLKFLTQGRFERLHDMYEDGMKEFFTIRKELQEFKQAKEDNKYGKWD